MSEVCSQCGTVIDNPLDAYGQFGNALCRACWSGEGELLRLMDSEDDPIGAEIHNLEVTERWSPQQWARFDDSEDAKEIAGYESEIAELEEEIETLRRLIRDVEIRSKKRHQGVRHE